MERVRRAIDSGLPKEFQEENPETTEDTEVHREDLSFESSSASVHRVLYG